MGYVRLYPGNLMEPLDIFYNKFTELLHDATLRTLKNTVIQWVIPSWMAVL